MTRTVVSILFFFLAQPVFASWTRVQSGTLSWLHDVAFVSQTRGFIVGSGGIFLETNDGGLTWKKGKSPSTDALKQIVFTDALNGWLLCERDVYNRGAKSSSYLMRTTDGGETWDRSEFGEYGRERIAKIFFNDKGNGFAVGENGTILESRDGNWTRQRSALRYLFLDGGFSDDSKAVIVGGGGSVLITDDGGETWTPSSFQTKPAGKLNAVFFRNRSTGWVVGAGGAVYQTLNGGRSWRSQKSGVAAELTDIEFIDSAEGYAVGADGTIIHTTTAGNIWTLEPTDVKHRIERVAANGKTVIAVGFGGTILTNQAKAPTVRQ